MSNPPSPDGLMAKADRACASARLLLDAGDFDGACNRAYRDERLLLEDARETVEQAERFVAAIRAKFLPATDSSRSGDDSQ